MAMMLQRMRSSTPAGGNRTVSETAHGGCASVASLKTAAASCAHAVRARWATIQVDAEEGTYLGSLYVPEASRRVSDVLNDERTFICLIDAKLNDYENAEPFVALNKRFVRAVRILREAEAAPLEPLRSAKVELG